MPTQAKPASAPPPEPRHAKPSSSQPRTLPVGEFKAKCLKLLDEVAATGEILTITQFGKPVAQIGPLPTERVPLFGAMRGSVLWEGDILSPLRMNGK